MVTNKQNTILKGGFRVGGGNDKFRSQPFPLGRGKVELLATRNFARGGDTTPVAERSRS